MQEEPPTPADSAQDAARITIRAYREADYPELERITLASFGGVSLEQLLEEKFGVWNGVDWKARKAVQIREDCEVNPEGVFLAERDGMILGYITTRVDHPAAKGRIPNLAVTEAARGAGVGRKLIAHALDHFRAQGMKVAQIETMGSNPIGQYLYPSCGFEEVARQVHYAMTL